MENFPIEHDSESRIVEPEIVGLEPPRPSLWHRIAARLAVSCLVGMVGVGLCLIGVVLTLSIIGAAVGIPMILLGIGAVGVAVLLLFGGGRMKWQFPRRP